MFIDAKTGLVIQSPNATTGGTVGFTSWKRLAQQIFPNSGELLKCEKLVRFHITESGINFYTEIE